MNRNLRYSLLMLLMAVCGWSYGQEVTLDFASNDDWGFPTSKATAAADFTNADGYTITLEGTSGNGYRWYNTGYLINGKQGATLTLPEFDFDVETIEVVGNSGASAGVKFNIFVGDEAVSEEVTGAQGTQVFDIDADYQAAGNVYVIKVTSDHNIQFTKINIYKVGSDAPVVRKDPELSFSPTSVTVTIGEEYELPQLQNPNQLEGIYYESSNTEVAYFEGAEATTAPTSGNVILTDKPGTAKITAKFDGNDEYKAGEASYTITVKEPMTGEPDYSFDFNSMQNVPTSSSSSNDGDITEPLTIEEDGVTLVISPKTSGSSANRWWSTNKGPQLRVYSGTLTFTSSGDPIQKIEFYNGKWNDGNEANVGTLESGSPATWTGSAQEVVISIGGNTQIDKVVVTTSDGTVKIDPALAFPQAEYTVTLGESFVAPALVNEYNVSPITYTSSNEDVASADPQSGRVSLKQVAGTTVITASFAGNDEYNASEASYTLTVKEQGEEKVYKKVKALNQIVDGVKYIIVCDNNNVAVADIDEGGNYRTPADVTVNADDETVTVSNADVVEFTITKGDDGYAIYDGTNYLTPSTSNNLKNSATAVYYSIVKGDNGCMAVVPNGDGRAIRYNTGSPRFCNYKSSNTAKDAFLYYFDDGNVPEPAEDMKVCESIAEFRQLEDGEVVTLQLENAEVLVHDGNNVYVRDANSDKASAICFYKVDLGQATTGSRISGSLVAKRASYNGLPELTDATDIDITVEENGVAFEPKEVDVEEATIDNYVADLIFFEGDVTMTGSNYYVGDVQLYVRGSVAEANSLYEGNVTANDKVADLVEEGDHVIVGGILTSYQNKPELYLLNLEKKEAKVEVEYTFNQYGVGTFYYSDIAFTIPDGVKAYTVRGAEGSTLTLQEQTLGIPAAQPVIIEGEPNSTVTFVQSGGDNEPMDDPGNLLKGTDEEGMTTGDGFHYMLGAKDGAVGFYFGQKSPNGEPFYIDAHKAWLVLPEANANGFAFDFNTTGIDLVKADTAADAPKYNMAGQRVNNSYRGIVIVNGKKYINK